MSELLPKNLLQRSEEKSFFSGTEITQIKLNTTEPNTYFTERFTTPTTMNLSHTNWSENNFNNISELDFCSSPGTRTVSLAEGVACVISILTVLENLAILGAITKGPRSLRKPPYWFIASLAAADLLTGFEVVLAIFVPVGASPISRIVLKGMAVVTFIVSINSLLLVSLDRYLRIAHHSDYDRIMKRQVVIILIALSWLMSFGIFLFAPLMGWSCAEQHCCAVDGLCVCKRSEFGDSVCNLDCSQSFVPFSKTYILSGVIYFLISIAIMVGFYSLLFKAVKQKTFGTQKSNSTSGGDTKLKKREVQLAKTLVITLGVFVVCWLPVMALFVADLVITSPTTQLAKVFDYALVPSVINSFLNPIIYSIRLPRMRHTVKRVALPCIFGGDKHRYLGATWATTTSLDKSIRRKSIKKRVEKLKGGSEASSSGSGRSAKHFPRSRMASTKSLNSEISYSHSSNQVVG